MKTAKLHIRYSPVSQSFLVVFGDPCGDPSALSTVGIGEDCRSSFRNLGELREYIEPMGLGLKEEVRGVREIQLASEVNK